MTIRDVTGRLIRRVAVYTFADRMDRSLRRLDTRLTTKGTQILLSLTYQELLATGRPLPSFDQVEFRAYSQNGEDGILLFIFSLIGTTNKVCVEMAAGRGTESNTANLLINHGWTGLLIDGNEQNVQRGREFYARELDTHLWPPNFIRSWLTRESVNELLRENGVVGEIDLLVLDLDGVDYWIWEAVDVIAPRVVLLEFLDIAGPDRAVTVPYDPAFKAAFTDGEANFSGASLQAFVKLARNKGYRFVGCQRYGFNAFFIRNDISPDVFPEADPAACFLHPKVQEGMRRRWPKVAEAPWVEV